MLIDPNLVMLYVASPTNSTSFYSELLGVKPIESSPTFAMFLLKTGFRLGLWAKHTVEPETTITGGGGELGLEVANDDTVNELFAKWQQQKLCIIQPPTMMDFGFTFVALDPDHHRIRVFSLKNS